jgi:hypothetical protein
MAHYPQNSDSQPEENKYTWILTGLEKMLQTINVGDTGIN